MEQFNRDNRDLFSYLCKDFQAPSFHGKYLDYTYNPFYTKILNQNILNDPGTTEKEKQYGLYFAIIALILNTNCHIQPSIYEFIQNRNYISDNKKARLISLVSCFDTEQNKVNGQVQQ